jgi:hypothetical protein
MLSGSASAENNPPFQGNGFIYFEVDLGQEQSCTSGTAGCRRAFSEVLAAGYDDVLVYLADFWVGYGSSGPRELRHLAAAVENPSYDPMTGRVTFDATARFDDGTAQTIWFTAKAGVLLYNRSAVHVAPVLGAPCAGQTDAACARSGALLGSAWSLPPGFDFVTFVPSALSWRVTTAGASVEPTQLGFDISGSPGPFSGFGYPVNTTCALRSAASPPLGIACDHTVFAVAAAPTTLALFDDFPSAQSTYGDGVDATRYLVATTGPVDPAPEDSTMVAWVTGDLQFSAGVQMSSAAGGCRSPRTRIDAAERSLAAAVYHWDPLTCGTPTFDPCPNRYIALDFNTDWELQCPVPPNPAVCDWWYGFSTRFAASVVGAATVTGSTECRMMNIF